MKTNIHLNNKHILWAAVAAVGLAAAAPGAQAGAAVGDVPARTVHYSDLDLGTQTGAAVLYNRIRYAAQQVCGNVDSRELARAVAAKACVDRAILSSVRAVQNAKLTEVYDAHAGVASKQINVASVR